MAPRHTEPSLRLRIFFLFFVYLLVVAGPLALAFFSGIPGNGWWVNFSVGLGFVALSVLGLQFVLTTHFGKVTAPFPIHAIMQYHRQISVLALFAAFGHPLILFLASPKYLPLLKFWNAPLGTQAAWICVTALALLILTSVFRAALHLSYRRWHITHSVLSVMVISAAFLHAFRIGDYMVDPWVRLAWAIYAAVFCWLAIWIRLVKPLQVGLRPWRVSELWPEPGGALTVALRPATRQDKAFLFHAGQFAMIQPRGALHIGYHPFTISSSALKPDQIEFTIKPVGAWTDAIRRVRVGDRMYVDGPHGSFTLEGNPGAGYVFLATGVGVTPFLAMLATLNDMRDLRQRWLFLGNRFEHEITGIRQINALSRASTQLRVVHTISDPSRQWNGETGRIDADLLLSYLPEHYQSLEFFICSRDSIARSLAKVLRELHVPPAHIHIELFRTGG